MFSHKQVWNAIDVIAERYGYSASGLAKKAGLDPTSFNPSKRNGPDGRPRWPTMESIARVLQASGAPVEEFMELLMGRKGAPAKLRVLPILGFARAARAASSMTPASPPAMAGTRWRCRRDRQCRLCAGDHRRFHAARLPRGRYDRVSPAATVRKGDRVVVRTTDGQVMAKIMQRQTAKSIELASFNPDHPNKVLDMKSVDWIARIIWASQ